MNWFPYDHSRRQTIRSLAGGSLLLPGILSELLAADARRAAPPDPLTPRPPHFSPRAKRVIFLYMSGGVSHVDSFDPKPKLAAGHGRPGPSGFFKGPQWEFRPRGRCGTEVSDLLPKIGDCADDFCLIRSMRGDHGNHFEATLGLHTAWVQWPSGPLLNGPAFRETRSTRC